MKVEQTHHIDASERHADGMYDWYYEYHLYRFTDGERTLVARSYADGTAEAHFLCFEVQRKPLSVTAKDIDDPLLKQATLHLRSIGKVSINYLSSEGYAPLHAEA